MHIDKERWQVLSPLLDELLEADEPTRALRLTQVRQDDAALADALAALLAPQVAMNQAAFLEGAVMHAIEPTLAGQQIGSYTLERPLGHGGMGMVWLAHRSDGRYEGLAAIKFLNLALFGPRGLERFQREGTVLARLTHPNIARLGDAGVTPLGQPYLVLEYVEGEPIDRWCDSHALDITARIRLFQQVLAAVEHAHGKLILHRDLKPSNILVTPQGQVKLLDFGIAKLLDDGHSARAVTELTQAAGRAFSPDFAAPEQVQGDEVTTATDVYSLGVLLHLLLTERHPTSRVTHTPVEKLRAIIETEPARPSDIVTKPDAAAEEALNPRLLARALRGDLDNILLKSLRKSPADRYASVGALAEDLQRYLNDEPVNARAASIAYQLGKFIRRHRVGVIAVASVLLASIIATAVTTEQMLEAHRQRDEAQRQRDEAQRQRDEAQYQSRRAEAVSNFLDLMLRSDGGPSRPALTLRERIDAGVKMLETQYRGDPRFAGRMMIHLSEGLSVRGGDNQRAILLLQRAYDLGSQSNDKELMATARCHSALIQAMASLMDEADKHMAEAQRLLALVDRPELNTRMECQLAQARLLAGRGKFDEAVTLLESAIRAIEADSYTHHPMYPATLSQLGWIHVQRNQIPAALEVSQRAIDAHERYGRGDTADSIASQQNTAAMLLLVGEAREALARRELINQRIRALEPEEGRPLEYIYNHSVVLLRMARADEAKAHLEGSLDRARRAQNPALLTQLLLAAGWSYIELGQWSYADGVLTEAAQVVNGGVPAMRGQLAMRRAQLSLARLDVQSARQHIDATLPLMGYGADKKDRNLSKALIVAADIALRQGLAADAEKFASDALAIAETVARGPDTSADVGEALLWLARARVALGTTQQVRSMLERSVRCLTNGLNATHPLTREAQAALANA